MYKRFLTATVAATVLTASLGATAAMAETETTTTTDGRPTLEAARRRCTGGVNRRLAEMDRLEARVEDARHLTDEHESALSSMLTDTEAALNELLGEIGSATDGAALREHCGAVLEDHRVFVLRRPQVNLVIATDNGDAAVVELRERSEEIGARIDAAEGRGRDVTEARAVHDDLDANIDEVDEGLDGIADTVLGFTPADYNENHDVLDPSREALKDVRTSLAAARADVRQLRQLRRGAATP